jgi:hypothetical protein
MTMKPHDNAYIQYITLYTMPSTQPNACGDSTCNTKFYMVY